MGQAKQRGTLAERKAAPLGDSWRDGLNVVDVPRPVTVAPAIPVDAMRRNVTRGESVMLLAALAGLSLGAGLRRR